MNLQQTLLMGRATKDCEVLDSKEGKKYARFTVAVNEYLTKTKETKSSFYECLVFNKTAQSAEKIKKGDLVMVDGRPEANGYLTNEGEVKANIVVIAQKWKLLK